MKRPPRAPAPGPEPVPPLGEVLDFMRLIWALDHRLRVESRRHKARRQLAYSQQLVLRIVGRFPSLSPGQLARLLHVDPSSVSGTIYDLSCRGLIEREPDPRDRRRLQLGLTEKGRATDVPAADGIEAVVSRTMRRLPEGRVAAAREVLESLVEAFGAPDGA
jgi:MarR family transcriptional regulator, organic hydroperoxide resistance regulator